VTTRRIQDEDDEGAAATTSAAESGKYTVMVQFTAPKMKTQEKRSSNNTNELRAICISQELGFI